jgi:dihydroneopterin aldolase
MQKDTWVKKGFINQYKMPGLITVELNQLRFFAYHGLYAEERRTGNEFEVNLRADYEPLQEVVEDISDTINYATLFELVKYQMLQPADLLETVVMNIANAIHTSFPAIKRIEITIAKLHPPIATFTGSVAVKFSRDY